MLLATSCFIKSHTSIYNNIVVRIIILILFITLTWKITIAETQNEVKEIEITVERAPYSLKFSISDTDNYKLENVTCSSINAFEQFANNENVCEDLLPCTTYRIVVSIKDLITEEIFNRDLINETNYKEPKVSSFKIEPATNSILLSWETIDSSCVLNYTIQVKATGNNIEKNINNKQQDTRIEGLNPCVEHFIEMRTYDYNGTMISNLTEWTKTQRAEPGIIPYIKIDTKFESGHAKVFWNQPDNKTCIDFFYLKWFKMDCELQLDKDRADKNNSINGNGAIEIPDKNSDEVSKCEWFSEPIDQIDSNEMEYLLKELDGCESYGIQIFINDKTNAKSKLEYFISADGMPDELIIEDPEILVNEVTLHWKAPTKNRKCIKEYEIKVYGPMQRENHGSKYVATEDVYAHFDGLEPCGLYVYTITIQLLNGTQESIVRSEFETLEAKPTAVRNIIIIPEPYAFSISWDQPEFADLCINEYRLKLWANGMNPVQFFKEIVNVTNVEIAGLIACQSYTIQIVAITKRSLIGDVVQMESETAAAIALPPENLQYTDLFSDGVELSTKSSAVNNTCDIIFARFICTPNSNDGLGVPKKSAERNVEGKVAGTSFKALLSPLSPFTQYICLARFFNIAGWSLQKQILITTLVYYADKPREISLTSVTNSSITFKWEPPLYPNGDIKFYMAHFQRVRPEFYIPPKCPPLAFENFDRVDSPREMKFENLHPYIRYSIQIAAKNDYGVGEYTRPFIAVTKPTISEPIKDLKVIPQGPYESDKEYRANVLVSWIAPCKSNGEIELFELEFRGERGVEFHHFNRTVPPDFRNDGIIIYNETNLKADFQYTISVFVRNINVKGKSAEKVKSFESPAGIPKRFNESTINIAYASAFEAANPTRTAVVRFPAYILESDTGSIIYAALLISEKGCNEKPDLVLGVLNSRIEWPKSRKWKEVYSEDENDCIVQYQTTKVRWIPKAKRKGNEIEFTVGTENCEECNDPDGCYCNGPLIPDKEYYVVIRLFTRSGYNDAAVLEFRTDSLVQMKVILISVSCCLLFAFIAGFMYIYITKRMLWKRQSYHDIEDPFGDIISKNFAKYYNEISKPEKLAREFKELTMVAMDFSYAASEMGRNKNRYVDIYPYDKNRVILDIDADGSDYINASFINGYRRKKEFIATQGPKPESTLDFWRMILQHNIRVIVMVTQFREGDKIKCHEYFPYKSMGINVIVKKKETFDLYDRSEMTVTHERHGLKQKVVHFYFKKWPDYGCPDDPMQLITFVRKVKAEKIPSYSSIVVHCSAGVGRTGTFIGLDIIMQRIKSESKINIYGTVKKLRFQRMKMVQSLEQYTFLYKCAYELVKHKIQRASNKGDKKKVTFQDNPETSSPDDTPISFVPVKTISRSIPSDLSSIEENELEYNENLGIHNKLNGKHLTMAQIQTPSTSSNGLNGNYSRNSLSVGMRLSDLSPNESSM